ncbi:methyltransferase FkbM family [Gracilaria domingensis]|nr:methyltransferase FkbM family [Gracilaria domingensis]
MRHCGMAFHVRLYVAPCNEDVSGTLSEPSQDVVECARGYCFCAGCKARLKGKAFTQEIMMEVTLSGILAVGRNDDGVEPRPLSALRHVSCVVHRDVVKTGTRARPGKQPPLRIRHRHQRHANCEYKHPSCQEHHPSRRRLRPSLRQRLQTKHTKHTASAHALRAAAVRAPRRKSACDTARTARPPSPPTNRTSPTAAVPPYIAHAAAAPSHPTGRSPGRRVPRAEDAPHDIPRHLQAALAERRARVRAGRSHAHHRRRRADGAAGASRPDAIAPARGARVARQASGQCQHATAPRLAAGRERRGPRRQLLPAAGLGLVQAGLGVDFVAVWAGRVPVHARHHAHAAARRVRGRCVQRRNQAVQLVLLPPLPWLEGHVHRDQPHLLRAHVPRAQLPAGADVREGDGRRADFICAERRARRRGR